MDKYKLIEKIENFANPDTAEKWDCSGWLVDNSLKNEVNKILLALTITDSVYEQAKKYDCDMIISHHPLFKVPVKYKDINMYCAHTNMDLADGGTTDTLLKILSDLGLPVLNNIQKDNYLRYVDTNISQKNLLDILSKVSANLRYTVSCENKVYKKIALCAGSGTEFIKDAYELGADCYISGDLKFHTAIESPIDVFDIGHFESEIFILDVFENILGKDIIVRKAKEKSPFITYKQ